PAEFLATMPGLQVPLLAHFHSLLVWHSLPVATAICTLSLHDALPICPCLGRRLRVRNRPALAHGRVPAADADLALGKRATERPRDRKSTRLNSSHGSTSYAVFCLKKKNGYSLQAGRCAGPRWHSGRSG